MKSFVLSDGGGNISSNNYTLLSTVGQSSIIGLSSSSSYTEYAGFWHLMTTLMLTKGDINGDGVVDLADAMLVLQILDGMDPVGVHSWADVNNDGKIGLEEVVYILQEVSGLR